MVHINDLPTELLEEILSYLNVKEKFQCELVCRRWQQILFLSIRSLAFGKIIQDPFLGFHTHEISKENQLYVWSSNAEYSKQPILAKCGINLRVFRGYVSHLIFHRFLKYCQNLHCIDVHISDPDDLKILGETRGRKLTCVTLRFEVNCPVSTFLSECPCLVSLAIFGVDHIYNATLHLFDIDIDQPELPHYLTSLRHLVIDGIITHYTLSQLEKFTQLKTIRLVITTSINKSDRWLSIMPHWSGLRALSLEVVGSNCANFEPLPPNLEYLALLSPDSGDYGAQSVCIQISTPLPKLRELHVYKFAMRPEEFKVIVQTALSSCPNLEKLSIGYSYEWYRIVLHDEDLYPLQLFANLKHLSIGNTFAISDRVYSDVITKLKHVKSIGICEPVCNESYSPKYAISGGKDFWNAVRYKANSKPSELFTFKAEANNRIPLHKEFPPNVTLILEDGDSRVSTPLKLHEGFGRSIQWEKWTAQWTSLCSLSLEIMDTSFKLSALPKYLTKLTINCLNEQNNRTVDPLIFKTHLSQLKKLKISHQSLSNSQLLITIECIAEFCPQIESLCMSRQNKKRVLADNFVGPIFQCESLKKLCVNENIEISDEMGSSLALSTSNLRAFGCIGCQKLGVTCGPNFLKALVTKARKGEEVALCGGISRTEFERIIGPMEIPSLLRII